MTRVDRQWTNSPDLVINQLNEANEGLHAIGQLDGPRLDMR